MPPSSSASPTTVGAVARRSATLWATGWRQTLGAEIGHQRRRDSHGAVGLLARLEQCRDGARQRHPGRLQRVDELGLRAGVWATPNVGAARLEIGARAGARGL